MTTQQPTTKVEGLRWFVLYFVPFQIKKIGAVQLMFNLVLCLAEREDVASVIISLHCR